MPETSKSEPSPNNSEASPAEPESSPRSGQVESSRVADSGGIERGKLPRDAGASGASLSEEPMGAGSVMESSLPSVFQQEVEFGQAGWLSLLLEEALERLDSGELEKLPTTRNGAGLDGWVFERLWQSGVILGREYAKSPGPLRTRSEAEAAYVQSLRFQLAVAVSLFAEMVAGEAKTREQLALALPTLLAATTGVTRLLLPLLENWENGGVERAQEETLISLLASTLHRNAYLEGNPPDGLPLHTVLAVIEARSFIRLAVATLQRRALPGKGEESGGGAFSTPSTFPETKLSPFAETLLRRAQTHLQRQSQLKAGAVELIAALRHSEGGLGERELLIARQQIRGLKLGPADRKRALAALENPQKVEDLLADLSPRLKQQAIEQAALVLAVKLPYAARIREGQAGSLSSLAEGEGIGEAEGTRLAASEKSDTSRNLAGSSLPGDTVDSLSRKTSSALTIRDSEQSRSLPWLEALSGPLRSMSFASISSSLEEAGRALAVEMRETAELGRLLSRAAMGEVLDDEERGKVKEQLLDLAKAVPALAILAAPGGTLLLPILLRILPFDLRPSAFRKEVKEELVTEQVDAKRGD